MAPDMGAGARPRAMAAVELSPREGCRGGGEAACVAVAVVVAVVAEKHGLVQQVPEGRCVVVGHPSSPDPCAEVVVCPGRPFIPQAVRSPTCTARSQ